MKPSEIQALYDMPACGHGGKNKAGCGRAQPGATQGGCFFDGARNALLPIVTLSALLFGELLAGAVLTEQIFTIPGFGKLIVDAVFNRDYGVVQGVVLCTAIGFILMNLIADILYALLDPKVRFE